MPAAASQHTIHQHLVHSNYDDYFSFIFSAPKILSSDNRSLTIAARKITCTISISIIASFTIAIILSHIFYKTCGKIIHPIYFLNENYTNIRSRSSTILLRILDVAHKTYIESIEKSGFNSTSIQKYSVQLNPIYAIVALWVCLQLASTIINSNFHSMQMILELNTLDSDGITHSELKELKSTATLPTIEQSNKHSTQLLKEAKSGILHNKILDINVNPSLVPIVLNYISKKIKRNFSKNLIDVKTQIDDESIIEDNTSNKNNDKYSYHVLRDDEHSHKETRASSNDMSRKILYCSSSKGVSSRPHYLAFPLNVKRRNISCRLMNPFISSPTKARCAKYPCQQYEVGLDK